MAKVKSSFVLKKSTSKTNLYYVILQFSFGYKEFNPKTSKEAYKPLRYPTGVSLSEEEWNQEERLPYDLEKLSQVQDLEKTTKDIYNYLVLEGRSITPKLLKEKLDTHLGKKVQVVKEESRDIRIVDFILDEIIGKPNDFADGTIKNYRKLSNKIDTFENESNIQLSVGSLNEETYKKFLDYLRDNLKRINSVWDMIKLLKAVLNEISRRNKGMEVFNPTTDLAKSDRVSSTTEEKVYMNFQQIQKVIDYDPPTEKLKNTKLIFLTLLFTGCRYSDVFKVKPEFTYEDKDITFRYARFLDQKTDKDIIVPILEPLELAYRENKEELPYKISDVKFNEYAKELVKAAKIDHDVMLSFTNSYGKKEYETKPYYKHMSSHIGRRSFITNLINFVPVTILSKITGHSLTNRNVIFQYNKITLLENSVLFVKELKRISETYPKDFTIPLVSCE